MPKIGNCVNSYNFYYMLEIDILSNPSQINLGVLRGDFEGLGVKMTPCLLRLWNGVYSSFNSYLLINVYKAFYRNYLKEKGLSSEPILHSPLNILRINAQLKYDIFF